MSNEVIYVISLSLKKMKWIGRHVLLGCRGAGSWYIVKRSLIINRFCKNRCRIAKAK